MGRTPWADILTLIIQDINNQRRRLVELDSGIGGRQADGEHFSKILIQRVIHSANTEALVSAGTGEHQRSVENCEVTAL